MCTTNINLVIELATLFIAIFGGVLALCQWKNSVKTKRAEFLAQLIEKIRFDTELMTTIYSIDYNQDWYNASFHRSELEFSMDKLLSYVDYICYLKETKNISEKEFLMFEYELHRICASSQIYLWNIYHFAMKVHSNSPFNFLIDYAIANEIFPSNFREDKTLYKIHKTLNF